MATPPRRCDSCRRIISDWVKELGFTIGHNGKNYCRFCYVRLRNAGKLPAKSNDSEFLSGINWELSMLEQLSRQRATSRQLGKCPACQSKLSFNLRGHAIADGICPKCNRHIKLLKSGKINTVPERASIIRSVNSRMGRRPRSIENVYAYLIDELAARLSEQNIFGIPELGTFQIRGDGDKLVIELNPSRRLRERIAHQRTHKLDGTFGAPCKFIGKNA